MWHTCAANTAPMHNGKSCSRYKTRLQGNLLDLIARLPQRLQKAVHSTSTFEEWESDDTPNGAGISIEPAVRLSHSSKLKAPIVFS